jgi:GNAT superfamily N-acetyltransferase
VRGGEVVAGVGVVPRWLLPRPRFPRGSFDAYVLNVYTEPAHRRRGLARRLMREVLAWARRKGAAIVSLHASDAGRPVYEGLGFKEGREMRIRLKGR